MKRAAFRVLCCLWLLVLCLISPLRAAEPGEIMMTGQEIRAAAELTTSEEAATTFALSNDVTAVILYVDFTTGSLTSATFTPTGNLDSTETTAAYKIVGYSKTFETEGRYVWRVPREEFGSYVAGMVCVGTGTPAGSSAAVRYRLERRRP